MSLDCTNNLFIVKYINVFMVNPIDQSDYIESAADMSEDNSYLGSNCKGPAPCKSCGGGCYGCKGSKAAEVSLEGRESTLSSIVENILED